MSVRSALARPSSTINVYKQTVELNMRNAGKRLVISALVVDGIRSTPEHTEGQMLVLKNMNDRAKEMLGLCESKLVHK